ncbi:hypothetical protein HYALB_00007355 [Hymenoscyphus albidus]|uniref:Uncharacterized protein n=1 Tax=Hymenoscyphus albidus TaxID=595503 RepID=A0A9N9Q489_9HELO|nr:hypothetical protein HYALB_00007355 [Hymenoscyphus albidus]
MKIKNSTVSVKFASFKYIFPTKKTVESGGRAMTSSDYSPWLRVPAGAALAGPNRVAAFPVSQFLRPSQITASSSDMLQSNSSLTLVLIRSV